MEPGIWEHQVCSQWCKPTPRTGETMVADMRHLLTRDTAIAFGHEGYIPLFFREHTVPENIMLLVPKTPPCSYVSASPNAHPNLWKLQHTLISSTALQHLWLNFSKPDIKTGYMLCIPTALLQKVSLGLECRPGVLLASMLVFKSSSAAPRHCGSKETSGVEI